MKAEVGGLEETKIDVTTEIFILAILPGIKELISWDEKRIYNVVLANNMISVQNLDDSESGLLVLQKLK